MVLARQLSGWEGTLPPECLFSVLCLCSYLIRLETTTIKKIYSKKNNNNNNKKQNKPQYIDFYRISFFPSLPSFLCKVCYYFLLLIFFFAAINPLVSVTARNKNPNKQKTPLKRVENKRFDRKKGGGRVGRELGFVFK